MIGHVGASPLSGLTCKAWVLFDPATGTIKSSSNIASVVRNGTNDWTITFTNAMASAFYLAVAYGYYVGSFYPFGVRGRSATPPTAGSVRLEGARLPNSGVDAAVEPIAAYIAFYE